MLKNLRAIRQERHMTQQQVANHLGITRQALSNYENGTREPEYDLLCRLAELLRCPVSRLLGFSGAYESAGARIPILGTVKGGFNLEDTHVITADGHDSFTVMPDNIFWK